MDMNDWLKKQSVFESTPPLPDEEPQKTTNKIPGFPDGVPEGMIVKEAGSFKEMHMMAVEQARTHNTDAVLMISTVTTAFVDKKSVAEMMTIHNTAVEGGEHPRKMPEDQSDGAVVTLEPSRIQIGSMKMPELFMIRTEFIEGIRVTVVMSSTEMMCGVNAAFACMSLYSLNETGDDES